MILEGRTIAFRLQRWDEEKEAVAEKEGGRRGRKRRKKTKKTKKNTKNIDLLILEP